MKSLVIQTLGCSKNTVDSEHVLAALSPCYELRQEGPADVFLINTCSFIADAKQQSIDAILEAVQMKQEGVYGKVVVFGCLGQRYASEMPELIPEVDAWFGARDFFPLLEYLGAERPLIQDRRVLSTPSHYAYLKISEGCDRRCAYCAIPLIRGPHRSVPVEDLVREAECLAAGGVKELIVIAQDSTFYGLDLYGKRDLARLLRALSAIEGIKWIRIHYSYPDSFPDDVLDEMASNPKICKYMDIPLQHISSSVLSRMHRGADGKAVRSLIAKMRERVPGVVLRTTMIVGFPGETQADFDELLDFVRDAKIERLGAFTYSEEEDTYSAIHYKDDVPQEVKDERYDALMQEQEQLSYEYNLSRVGTQAEVIVDSCEGGILVCRSQSESPEVDGDILVKYEKAPQGGFEAETLVGQFIKVRIIGADSYDLIAELL